jgi:hypothetical protein
MYAMVPMCMRMCVTDVCDGAHVRDACMHALLGGPIICFHVSGAREREREIRPPALDCVHKRAKNTCPCVIVTLRNFRRSTGSWDSRNRTRSEIGTLYGDLDYGLIDRLYANLLAERNVMAR